MAEHRPSRATTAIYAVGSNATKAARSAVAVWATIAAAAAGLSTAILVKQEADNATPVAVFAKADTATLDSLSDHRALLESLTVWHLRDRKSIDSLVTDRQNMRLRILCANSTKVLAACGK